MAEKNGKDRIEDADIAWRDQEGEVITLSDCVNACYLAASLFLKELEFNPKIKENAYAKYEYERSRIIMLKLKENYERALKAIQEAQIKKTLIPGRQAIRNIRRKK